MAAWSPQPCLHLFWDKKFCQSVIIIFVAKYKLGNVIKWQLTGSITKLFKGRPSVNYDSVL